jgi:tetratricopeptide (TPR) repeat protein
VFLAAIALIPAAGVAEAQEAASPVRVEASPQLFATVAALYAAGFTRGPDSSESDPLVARLRALQGPATEAIREYYRERAGDDPAATLSRYVAFALASGPPPKFEAVVRREELPPEVIALEGFGQLLEAFYHEAGIESLWRERQARYEQDRRPLHDAVGRIVFSGTGYLRELLRPGARTFIVYVEPLVGGQTHVRNIGDRYAMVVNSAVNPVDEIRHAFLHFMLDPMAIRHRDQLLRYDPIFRTALRAPRLPESLRRDNLALFAECLVRAVELRMQRLPAARLAEELNRAERDGLVLVRSLADGLVKFEADEPAMSFYFPDLFASIDILKEQARLQTVAFATASEPVAVPAAPSRAASSSPASEAERAVAEGERLNSAKDTVGAAAAFERALVAAPNHPRALYGLAVTSVLQGQAERAYELFTQVVAAKSSPDAAMRPDSLALSWAHVYLGRLHDLAGEREEALAEYRSALAVPGAPEAARAAAQMGMDQAYQPAVRSPAPG